MAWLGQRVLVGARGTCRSAKCRCGGWTVLEGARDLWAADVARAAVQHQQRLFRAEEEGGVGEAGLAQRVLVSAGGTCRIVLISGFESFNVALYEKVRAHERDKQEACGSLETLPHRSGSAIAMVFFVRVSQQPV